MIDLSREALGKRIDALRGEYTAYSSTVRSRNRAYLRAYSPPFDERLGEHDQWPDKIKASDAEHTRSSYNITRATVDIWTSLEASVFPSIRWWEDFIPTPVPSLDEEEDAQRQTVYRAAKLTARQLATLREQGLKTHIRRTHLHRHYYRAIRRKNLYGNAWLKTWPDQTRRTFRVETAIDNSSVYPVWSAWDSSKLDAILVAYRKSARTVAAQYPGSVNLESDGLTAQSDGYYYPTAEFTLETDRRFVWVEDYWVLDEEMNEDGEVTASRVANAVRVNGKIVADHTYDGWKRIPYVFFENEDERDRLGFSDAGSVLAVNDGFNRMASQQQDVIFGSSRPRFKYRGDADREIDLRGEEVVSLDQDEDIDQIRVALDVYPTQAHGQLLTGLWQRITGLSPTVFGEITAAQNSGRALATAWRATAARLAPRLLRDGESVFDLFTMWLDWLELYDWYGAQSVYEGSRDFDLDFPNQEPRDFTEVTVDSVNRYNAGAFDLQALMEALGEESPDEMIERVRAERMDTVLHPDKAQAYLLLRRLQQQIEIEARQAGLAEAAAQAQLQQVAAPAPGNAPAGGSMTPEQQQAAADAAAQQQAATVAPQLMEGQNAPAGVPGGPPTGGGASTRYGTLVQDGRTMNRLIDQGPIS